ncbi:MAG: nuclear transport factor 2 family protein [Deltaproteobacteria bacterium]|nr:nuclear transport factor 2 family protein [Deltaproteobacteria bacterium]
MLRVLWSCCVCSALLAISASAHVPDRKAIEATPAIGAKPVDPGLADVEKRYRAALEKLDVQAFGAVHHKDVVVFESGHKNLGWADYEKNHLQPEVDAMKSFRFTRWDSATQVYGDTGVVVADIGYVIELKSGERHEATGVATLVLRPAGKGWAIVHSHWSTARSKQLTASPPP